MSFLEDVKRFERGSLTSVETVVTKHSGRKIRESINGEELPPSGGGLTLDLSKELDEVFEDFFVLDLSPDKGLHKVCSGLFIGSQDASSHYEGLTKHKISHILNVAIYTENHFPDSFVYKNVPMYDVPTFDISQHFEECSAFMSEAINQGGAVLCHCNAGISRSSAVIVAYLMKYQHLSMDDALDMVLNARPIAQPNTGFLIKLKEYEAILVE